MSIAKNGNIVSNWAKKCLKGVRHKKIDKFVPISNTFPFIWRTIGGFWKLYGYYCRVGSHVGSFGSSLSLLWKQRLLFYLCFPIYLQNQKDTPIFITMFWQDLVRNRGVLFWFYHLYGNYS